jgi:hypothetical protein
MTALANFIRDQLVERLVSIEPSPWKTIRTSPVPSLSSDKLPSLGVFFLRENMIAQRDENVSVPSFISDLILGLSVVAISHDGDALQAYVDSMADIVLNRLLQDGSFASTLSYPGTDPSGAPPDSKFLIDSFPNIQRTYNVSREGESHVIECRLQMTIRYWCNYPPLTPYWLKLISVAVQPPPETTPTVTIPFNIPWGP